MRRLLAVAAALALGMGAAQAQDKKAEPSTMQKIEKAGEANSKARDSSRDKKRAEEDARSRKNKEARDQNPPGSALQKQVSDTQKGMDEQRAKNKDAKKPKY
jgi:opacity protein-like surface antigen